MCPVFSGAEQELRRMTKRDTFSPSALAISVMLGVTAALLCAPSASAFPWSGEEDSMRKVVELLKEKQREAAKPERTRVGSLKNPARVTSADDARALSLESTAVIVLGRAAEVMPELNALDKLESLELISLGEIDDATLAALASLKSLRKLTIQSCTLASAESYKELAKLSRLETLEIKLNTQLDDACLEQIAKYPAIEELMLTTCTAVSDAGVKHLASLRTLNALEISANAKITPEGLSILKGLPDLDTLNLRQCTKLDDSTGTTLAAFASLQHLDLSRTGVGDEGLVQLARLSGIKSLALRGLWQIGERGVRQLAKMKTLELLDLGGCTRIPATAFPLLAELPALSVLKLDECSLDDAALAALAVLPLKDQLKELSLSATLDGSTSLSANGLRKLTAFAALEKLNLMRQAVDADLLESLATLALTRLNLSGCKALDADSLMKLSACKTLSELELRQCPGLTEAALSEMREAAPEMKVIFELAPQPVQAPPEDGDDDEEGSEE